MESFFCYICVWVELNEVPTSAVELAGFDVLSLKPHWIEHRALHGEDSVFSSEGFTLRQTWLTTQLVFRREMTCVVSLDAPDLAEIHGVSRLVTLPPVEILNIAATALVSRSLKVVSAFVNFDGASGHAITLDGYDETDSSFIFYDPWPGRSLLAKYTDTDDVQPGPGQERNWRIGRGVLARLLHSIMIETSGWDTIHGLAPTSPPEPEQRSLPPQELTADQLGEIVGFIVGCAEAGVLSDLGLVGVCLIIERGIMFHTSRDGETTLSNLRGLVNTLLAQGQDPEPLLTRTLLALGEPTTIIQGALLRPADRDTPHSPEMARALSHAQGRTSELLRAFGDFERARQWAERAAATVEGFL